MSQHRIYVGGAMIERLGPYLLGPNDTPENGIYTGDARELAKAIPDESVDLALTDPPFGIGFRYRNGYDDSPQRYFDEWMSWLPNESDRVIKPGCLAFVFQAGGRLRQTWPFFPSHSRIFALCKNFVQMNRGDVPYAFDPVVFWQKGNERLFARRGRDWFVANTAATLNRGMAEAGWHSCPRPLDGIIYIVDTFCRPNGTVVDFCVGSGTTAVAAKTTGRKYLAFEIDPDTAEMARQRVRQTQPPLFVPEPQQQEMLFERKAE